MRDKIIKVIYEYVEGNVCHEQCAGLADAILALEVEGKAVCEGDKRNGCPEVHDMHPCTINKDNDVCYSRIATI